MRSKISVLSLAVCVAGGLTLAVAPAAHAGTATCAGYAVTVPGTAGPDTLHGTSGRDVIAGFGGDDTIDGVSGSDIVCGGAGNDTITVTRGLVHGGGGEDVISSQRAFSNLFGEGGGDRLLCAGPCHAYGGNGNDRLVGGVGPRGNDLDGGNGDDVLRGNTAADRFDLSAGHDRINGRGGQNILDCVNAVAGVDVDLVAGRATSAHGWDTKLRHIADINGTPYSDRLLGDGAANIIVDRGPNSNQPRHDVIKGRGGKDVLSAHFPDTGRVVGGHGRDRFDAQDKDIKQGGVDGVVIDLARHTGVNRYGPDAGASMRLSGIENVQGSSGKDILRGDAGRNVLAGYLRTDRLAGRGGNDRLFGDAVSGATTDSGDRANGGSGTDLCRAAHTTRCEKP